MNTVLRSTPPTPFRMRAPQQPAARRPRVSFDLAWLNAKGRPEWETRVLPLSDVMDAAVSSLARGALLATPDGHVAIEDLVPGMEVVTFSGTVAKVQWVGSRCIPETACEELRTPLYRVTGGAFGHDAPSHDVVLAQAASVLVRTPGCRKLIGQDSAFAPIIAFEDSFNVTRIIPAGEMTVYNLALHDHEAVIANGLPVETFHPARNAGRLLTQDTLLEMARLFPHLSASNGFGPQRIMHLSLTDARSLEIF